MLQILHLCICVNFLSTIQKKMVVDFIFKIVDAQRALRALIPVKMIQNWKSLLEERAKSVVTSLLPRVQSNLTIRNLDGVDEDGDGEGDRRGTYCSSAKRENFNHISYNTQAQEFHSYRSFIS